MVRKISTWLVVLLCLVAAPAIAGEGRIPIWVSGTVIANPGQYVVTRNLGPSALGGPVIVIASGSVDLDLNGFEIDNGANPAPVINVGNDDVRIRNGQLLGGTSSIEAVPGRRLVLEDLNARGAGGAGFLLHNVDDVAIRRNRIRDMGAEGIVNDGASPKSGIIEGNEIRGTQGGIHIVNAGALTIRLNQIQEMFAGPSGAGITLDTANGGTLVSQNTIWIVDDDGIELRESVGSKIHNNVIRRMLDSGILVDSNSSDNLIIENTITGSGLGNGLLVEGDRNHIDENLSNDNAICGLHFTATAFGNTLRKNSMRGNNGGAPCVAACGAGATTDFCDLGAGNSTNGDNFMPAPGL